MHFSIEKDRKYVLPILKLALKINPELQFFASPLYCASFTSIMAIGMVAFDTTPPDIVPGRYHQNKTALIATRDRIFTETSGMACAINCSNKRVSLIARDISSPVCVSS